MKRLFGGPNVATPLPTDGLGRSDAYATQSGPPPSSMSSHTSQRAPLYNRGSYGPTPSTTSQAGSQIASHAYPHTPSASSMVNGEYFAPPQSLSPSASRQTGSSPYAMTFGAALQSNAALLAPQPTGTSFAQPTQPQLGTTTSLADPNASLTNMQAHAVERSDLHKTVKAMECVLVSFDEYRELKTRMAKCEKKLAKGLSELARAKAFEEVPSQTLQAASDVLEARVDVSTKQAKLVQKEYEATNEHCAKYFKRIAKEEKAFDEQLETLDSKIKKAHASHDKNVKKGASRSAIESHDKFIQTMQGLTADVTRLKTAHGASVGQRTFLTSLTIAATMGSLADVEFKSLCESVRKAGQHVGTLHQWLNLTSCEALAKVQPVDVSDDACAGLAQKIAAKEAEIREEWQRQEQARFKQLEEEHAMLALQQLGWTPPAAASTSTIGAATSPPGEHEAVQSSTMSSVERNGTTTRSAPPPPKRSLSFIPRLDSSGNLVERANVSPQRKGTILQSNKATDEPERESESYEHERRDSSLAEGTVIIRDSAAATTAGGEVVQMAGEASKTAVVDSDDTNSASSSGMSTSASNSSATSKGSEDVVQGDPKAAGPLSTIDEKADDDASSRRGDVLPLRAGGAEERKNAAAAPSQQQTDVQRKSSLWERERERERNIELERRLAEAENRLRTLDHRPSVTRTGTTTEAAYEYNRMPTANGVADPRRARYSEPPVQSVKAYPVAQQRDESVHAASQRYEAERYAPAVGSSRIAGQSLTRSLSTDSERSFVARMKAVYQSEKGVNSSDARIPLNSAPYDSRSSYTTQQASGRGRYDSAPTGSVRRDATAQPTNARRGVETTAAPPHASSCGCWQCSGRHYGTGDKNIAQGGSTSTRAGVALPQPPPRHPSAAAALRPAPPPNVRRQTMQVPPQHVNQHDARAYDEEYGYYDRDSLSPPFVRDDRQFSRRSLDDEDRGARMSYAKEHGTVR